MAEPSSSLVKFGRQKRGQMCTEGFLPLHFTEPESKGKKESACQHSCEQGWDCKVCCPNQSSSLKLWDQSTHGPWPARPAPSPSQLIPVLSKRNPNFFSNNKTLSQTLDATFRPHGVCRLTDWVSSFHSAPTFCP